MSATVKFLYSRVSLAERIVESGSRLYAKIPMREFKHAESKICVVFL